jgi:predicted nucleic acid-binding Zn ribbon protein
MSDLNTPLQPSGKEPYSGPAAVPPSSSLKPCDVCGKDIQRSALKCTECESAQGGTDCLICGARIPRHALRCSQCDSFQDWRRHIPGNQVTLALLVSILSVLSTLSPQILRFINLRSETAGFFLDVEKQNPNTSTARHYIRVRLRNEGGRPAQVEKATASIEFRRKQKDSPSRVKSTELDIINRGAMIIPASSVSDLLLYVDDLTFDGAPNNPAKNDDYKAGISKELCSTNAFVVVNIRERSRFNSLGAAKPVEMEMTKSAAQSWVQERLVGRPQEPNCR